MSRLVANCLVDFHCLPFGPHSQVANRAMVWVENVGVFPLYLLVSETINAVARCH